MPYVPKSCTKLQPVAESNISNTSLAKTAGDRDSVVGGKDVTILLGINNNDNDNN